jgi:tetratricopeptide (TPR) repeat protein
MYLSPRKSRRLLRHAWTLLLLGAVSCALPASAQSAVVKGTVRDSGGKTLAGIEIVLKDPGGAVIGATKTDALGAYQFPSIKSGSYKVQADSTGYNAQLVPEFSVKSNDVKVVDIILASSQSKTQAPEFYDEPQFTVAGVTDTTNLGTHGADTVVRNTESLVRDTASMNKPADNEPRSSPDHATLQSLREGVERAPDSFEANYQLGKSLLESGDAREAASYLERAASLNPADAHVAYDLANACIAVGDYQHAKSALQSSTSRPQSGANYRLLGDVEEKLGDPVSAVHEYQRAAELEPSELNLFSWGAELLMHRAFEPASEVFAKGNRTYPNSVRMLVGLGVSLYARGSYEEAVRRLCQASDLDPGATASYLFLGKIQTVDPAHSQEISKRLERFARLHPENAQAIFYYAMSLWKARRGPEDTSNLDRIESLLKRATNLDPKMGDAYLQLGVLYEEQNKLPSALIAYQQAIEANPDLEQAHYRLAQAYRKNGSPEKAKAEMELYQRAAKQATEAAEREQREIQAFVYTVRDQTYGTPPAQKSPQ